MNDCIFCKIVKRELPSTIVYEDEKTMVFKNIKPSAPVHLLAISKKHISSIDDVTIEDRELMGDIVIALQRVAKEEELKGYKIAVNVGKNGGQEIFHLHFHLLGGWKDAKQELI